jgi:hypothetical protein
VAFGAERLDGILSLTWPISYCFGWAVAPAFEADPGA